jgi:hypothetical protein
MGVKRDEPGTESQTIRYRAVTLGAVVLGGQVDVRLAAGPWWAGFLLAVLGLTAVLVRIVFPQDSPDKVTWWRERRRASRHRGADTKRRKRRASRPSAGAGR